MDRSWWRKWPGLMEAELKALDEAGIPYQRDEDAFRRGVLALRLQPTVGTEVLDLIAIYPQLFPYFRFEVFAPKIVLPRHRNPFVGNLCLIGRGTWNWHTTDKLADYLTVSNRLPALLESARSQDRGAVSHLEESQGEPFSDYYLYASEAMLLVDSAWGLSREITQGELEIALSSSKKGGVRGAVTEVRDLNQNVLATCDTRLAGRYKQPIQARWIRVSKPLMAPDGQGLMGLIERLNPRYGMPRWKSINNRQTDIIGVVFPEELREGVIGDGWLFVIRQRRNRRETDTFAVRACRYGPSDLRGRIPELNALAEKCIAAFGLGGIGAPAAVEFARAGIGELRLLDHDFIDPGTTVRWPLGLNAAGLAKTNALPEFLATEYPLTTVRAWKHRIGGIPDANAPSDLDVLEEILDGADLIFDATAEPGVHHLLCDLAWARGLPYVTAHTTAGAWGGLVARLDPRVPTGCWFCLQNALYNDDHKTIDEPPFNAAGNVQPLGCADPTFTGAGFDVVEVTLEAIRTAVGTLCADVEDGYPQCAWEVAVVSLRDDVGKRIAPRWKTYPLAPVRGCACGDNREARRLHGS